MRRGEHVEELAVGKPPAPVDNLVAHHGDMSGGTAERRHTKTEEEAREFRKGLWDDHGEILPGARTAYVGSVALEHGMDGTLYTPDITLNRPVSVGRRHKVMTLFRSLAIGLTTAFGVLLVAQAQTALPEVDRFGPQVGEAVPDFSLVDQTGRTRDLSSILGPNGAMVVFSRSAAW